MSWGNARDRRKFWPEDLAKWWTFYRRRVYKPRKFLKQTLYFSCASGSPINWVWHLPASRAPSGFDQSYVKIIRPNTGLWKTRRKKYMNRSITFACQLITNQPRLDVGVSCYSQSYQMMVSRMLLMIRIVKSLNQATGIGFEYCVRTKLSVWKTLAFLMMKQRHPSSDIQLIYHLWLLQWNWPYSGLMQRKSTAK